MHPESANWGAPVVSVVMPVHNGERYLGEAVSSILNQTFVDFEFIVIDDASTDSTRDLLRGYTDPRIRVLANARNCGVTRSLNRGLSVVRGRYVARMDADDVSLPERLTKQVAFLERHPEVMVVATRVALIDDQGRPAGHWHDDAAALTPDAIRRQLPTANCIAHASVLMRAAPAVHYSGLQRVSQDWDLWLRLVSDGHVVAKLNEVLVRHRVHAGSITVRCNRGSIPRKVAKIQGLYLLARAISLRFTRFDLRVLKVFLRNVDAVFCGGRMASRYWRLQMVRREVRRVWRRRHRVVLDHARFLKWVLRLRYTRNPGGLFFFFPFRCIGGAENVHAAIVRCVADLRPCVFFSLSEPTHAFADRFGPAERQFDVAPLIQCGFEEALLRVLAYGINQHPRAVVFGCNSMLFYRLLPRVKAHVRAVDLLHAFGGGIESASVPFVPRLDVRVVISPVTVDHYRQLYAARGLDPALIRRIVIIENAVVVPATVGTKGSEPELRVLYVGRGAEEKRVHLVGHIAAACHRQGLAVSFTLVGDVVRAISPADRPFCRFVGEILDTRALDALYAQADVLVLTSSREGFPLVVMEAMAAGVVPVCTNVGGLARHAQHRVNSILIENTNESEVVGGMVDTLAELVQDRQLLRALSGAAHAHARTHFHGEGFCRRYRAVLTNQPEACPQAVGADEEMAGAVPMGGIAVQPPG